MSNDKVIDAIQENLEDLVDSDTREVVIRARGSDEVVQAVLQNDYEGIIDLMMETYLAKTMELDMAKVFGGNMKPKAFFAKYRYSYLSARAAIIGSLEDMILDEYQDKYPSNTDAMTEAGHKRSDF
tara:strand:+ start:1024 stop:1401 length:378 start_codon:yes stop_codon:yes gene_type:complete